MFRLEGKLAIVAGAGQGVGRRGRSIADAYVAFEKGISAPEIASRVCAYPTLHADLKFLV